MAGNKTSDPAKAAENNLMTFNQEAFESALEMQMSFLETASRFAGEFTSFAMRRAEINAEDMAKLAEVKSPPELLQMQLERMRATFDAYSSEADRLLGITQDVVKESGEAIRSSYLDTAKPKSTVTEPVGEAEKPVRKAS